jgi:hypothetical protein
LLEVLDFTKMSVRFGSILGFQLVLLDKFSSDLRFIARVYLEFGHRFNHINVVGFLVIQSFLCERIRII